MSKNIDLMIKELISSIGEEFKVLKYVYNNNKEFIPGATPVYYSGPYWEEKEVIEAIKCLLIGDWLSSGDKVKTFENVFARKINQKYGVMVNSGSSANLVMMAALKKYYGWQDNDEVIISVVGFPTTLAPIIQNNLKPVFIDIEMDTLNFDLNLIEEKITDKTKAIIGSPVLGNPFDFDKLIEMCERRNIKLILDNCDSLGSKWRGKYLNEYSVVSSNSFYPSHHISTAEGGMVVSNDKNFIKLTRSFAWWGRECFTESAPIYTSNGVKLIKDIEVDDLVLTHTGRYQKVQELIRRKYTGNLMTIMANGKERIICTENHPFYILRDNEYVWELAKNLKNSDYLLQSKLETKQDYNVLNVEYNTLVKMESASFPLESDLMRLIGYWLAEGSLAIGKKDNGRNKNKKYDSHRVDFSFNSNEQEYIQDVTSLVKKYFNCVCNVRYRKNQNSAVVTFKSRKAYEFFKKYCNEYSYKKQLPVDFLQFNNDLLKQLIKGIWRGDGSSSQQSYDISTSSQTLACQLIFILIKLGIYVNQFIRTPEKHMNNIVNGRLIKAKHNLYNLVIYRPNALNFGEIVDEKIVLKSKSKKMNMYFTDDGLYACSKIKQITSVFVENVDVYNFEVENDHSYHAYGIISHNCFCVGAGNLLQNGSCGNRFDKWLEGYDGIIDHKYVFANVGYNLKPLDLQGAIGLVQMERIDEIHAKRKESKRIIGKLFEDNIDGIIIPEELEHAETSWFGTPIICENRQLKDRLVNYLENKKIQTRNYFAGNILLHPGYKHLDDFKKYPKANEVLDRVFFIGASPHYHSEIFNYIESTVRNFK